MALGHEIAGKYTPIEGFDLGLAPRRIALDKAGVDTALAAGATGIFGTRVVDLLGSGTEDDQVRGVRLADGREIEADWVFGADGRGSMVAGKLGLEKERTERGELAFSYSYWSGIPVDEPVSTLQINLDEMLYHGPVEDGLYLVIANGVPDLAQGTKAERERKYMEAIRRFPETLDPKLLDDAEMVTEVTVAPETLMRGFYRRPAGPGWALVGDASYFKHPGTAQGIGDAVEAALYVADTLSGGGDLDGYEEWRDAKSAEHYNWSFAWGRFPNPETAEPLFRGWASDPDAGQDLRDCLARTVEPSQLMSRERLERWFAPA